MGLEIEETDYFRGLQAYIEMVHDDAHAPSFGMIVYTNTLTATLFQKFFPLERYPNLILAIPEWPLYTTKEGDLENTVLTTMRYQAVEAFPNANLHMRDADTLFVSLLGNLSSKEFYELVRDWEDTYLREFLPKVEAFGKQIVLGSHEGYTLGIYHGNLIYPVDFTFPLNLNRNYELFPFVPSLSAYNWKFPYERYREIFKRKFVYGTGKEHEGHGVFAGFSSVLRNRTGIENFWAICVDYMVQRYKMTRNSISNRFHSNSHYAIGKDERMLLYGIIPKFFDTIFFMEIVYYGELPSSLNKKIKTRENIEALKHHEKIKMASPSYFKEVPLNVDPSKPYTLPAMFRRQVDEYEKWLASMKEAFPTEEEFLNYVNKDVSKALAPEELLEKYEKAGYVELAKELKGWKGNAGRTAFARYTAAGKKATVRHGGGPRKKRSSKTQKKRTPK